MNPIVSLEDVSLRYHSIGGETSAVSHLSLSVQAGEFISIVGPSGCGKSTILSMLAGQLAPSEGSIYIGGTIGYMLQKDYLLQWRSIRSNALLGLEIQKKLTPENIAYVDTLLTQYGLGDFKNSLPNQLSGGMRQRAALIRTLAVRPDILLLDEPFSALDYQTRLSVSDEIGTIIREEGKTAILVTHDISEAISLSDRVVVFLKRPASLKKIFPIQFSTKNHTPMQAREALNSRIISMPSGRSWMFMFHEKNTFPRSRRRICAAHKKAAVWLLQVLLLILFFLLWEIAADCGWIDPFLFSQPTELFATAVKMIRDGSLFLHIGTTLRETVIGFLLGTILGTLTAVLLWWNRFISDVAEPYLVVLNSLPKTALAPIIIVWFGNNQSSIIIVALLTSIVVTILSVLNGFLQVDEDQIKLIRIFGGTKRQVLTKVVFLRIFPCILNALKINVGLSFVGVIVGEFLVAQDGLGFLIVYSRRPSPCA